MSGRVWVSKVVVLRPPFRVSLILIAVIEFGYASCTTVQLATLREKPRNPLSARLKLTDPNGPRPSPRTDNLLAATDAVKVVTLGHSFIMPERSSQSRLPLSRCTRPLNSATWWRVRPKVTTRTLCRIVFGCGLICVVLSGWQCYSPGQISECFEAPPYSRRLQLKCGFFTSG